MILDYLVYVVIVPALWSVSLVSSLMILGGCRSGFQTIVAPGSDGGSADAGDAAGCTPGCVDDVWCVDGAEQRTCALGCDPSGRCHQVIPSNLPQPLAIPAGTANVVVPDGETWVLDSVEGRIDAWRGSPEGDPERLVRGVLADGDTTGIVFDELMVADGLRDMGVVRVASLTIEEGATLQAKGDNVLIIVSEGDIVVRGRLSVAAFRLPAPGGPGAGGFQGSRRNDGRGPGGGLEGQTGQPFTFGGGGGGSYGSAGAPGGTGNFDGTGLPGEGGATYGEPTLIPLIGGSAGGAGASFTSEGSIGGNGGGALQLVSQTRILLGSQGRVDASGGGGLRGRGGGSGGGSGGAILLEAPTVDVEVGALLGVSGGAGARGITPDDCGVSQEESEDGADGRAERTPAPGTSTMVCSGGGGAGSDSEGEPRAGKDARDAGGGGGGAGRIRINTGDPDPSRFELHVVPALTTDMVSLGVPQTTADQL